LALLPGVIYIERCALSGVAQVRKAKKAVKHAFELQKNNAKGLSLVELLSPCPVYWRMTPADAMEWTEKEMTKVVFMKRLSLPASVDRELC
jgi:2-oxoglutarate ferredoxin oxidoreductase subunit beta